MRKSSPQQYSKPVCARTPDLGHAPPDREPSRVPALELIARLKSTLRRSGKDYEQWIREFGQVDASERRALGGSSGSFGLREHVRGLLMSQLSAQRPWGPIARNLDAIAQVFLDFDPAALAHADPNVLASAITDLRCGNRQLARQMQALSRNIETLRRIESDYGSVDAFVNSRPPSEIAETLSRPGPYKLRYIGFTLALEYLRNVGIRAGKPDLHVRRILGVQRLGLCDGSPKETALAIETLAEEADCNPTYLDNLLWIYCATDYGDICGADPHCGACDLRRVCRRPDSPAT